MTDNADGLTITPLYTPPEDLALPLATYVISGGSRLVVIDPGPASHLISHLDSIAALVDERLPLVVVIQTPEIGAFSGLAGLASLSSRRSVILHWKAASAAGSALEDWKVRTLTTKSAGLPLAEGCKLAIGISPAAGPPGSLLSFETSTGTLFSGPFLGSIGPGYSSGQPVLRRESVRAYRDAITPHMPPDIVENVFGSELAVNQIAPSHGKIAVGGSSLIQTVFGDAATAQPVPHWLHRVFVRIAALIGVDAAAGIYRATNIPVPEVETGYRKLRDGEAASLSDEHWKRLLEALEQWVSGPALTAILPVAAEAAEQHDLPLTRGAERFAAATVKHVLPVEGNARDAAPGRAIGTADMPGTVAAEGGIFPAGSELTDPATGLMNETVFKQRLAGQFGSEPSPEGAGSVILAAIDGIQRINNVYGRTGGDDAIYTVAYLLRNFQAAHSRRGAHRLYKLGGPHFAYVLSAGGVEEGADVAERIRRAVAESAMFLEQLTVSVGVVGLDEIRASEREGAEPRLLADELASRAFGRLRVAQQGGANSVCGSDPSIASTMSSGSTILLADPDAPYLSILTQRLEDEGYTVLLARDGAEAIGIIDQIVPDAIVAEVMLPKTNGLSLREALRHDSALSRIPFVLVSHRKTDEMLEKASMLGIVHFLEKPFSLVELVGLLRNLTRDAGGMAGGGGTS